MPGHFPMPGHLTRKSGPSADARLAFEPILASDIVDAWLEGYFGTLPASHRAGILTKANSEGDIITLAQPSSPRLYAQRQITCHYSCLGSPSAHMCEEDGKGCQVGIIYDVKCEPNFGLHNSY